MAEIPPDYPAIAQAYLGICNIHQQHQVLPSLHRSNDNDKGRTPPLDDDLSLSSIYECFREIRWNGLCLCLSLHRFSNLDNLYIHSAESPENRRLIF